VEVRRDGDSLVLAPVPESWRPLIESLEMFFTDFMEQGRQQLAPQGREAFFR